MALEARSRDLEAAASRAKRLEALAASLLVAARGGGTGVPMVEGVADAAGVQGDSDPSQWPGAEWVARGARKRSGEGGKGEKGQGGKRR